MYVPTPNQRPALSTTPASTPFQARAAVSLVVRQLHEKLGSTPPSWSIGCAAPTPTSSHPLPPSTSPCSAPTLASPTTSSRQLHALRPHHTIAGTTTVSSPLTTAHHRMGRAVDDDDDDDGAAAAAVDDVFCRPDSESLLPESVSEWLTALVDVAVREAVVLVDGIAEQRCRATEASLRGQLEAQLASAFKTHHQDLAAAQRRFEDELVVARREVADGSRAEVQAAVEACNRRAAEALRQVRDAAKGVVAVTRQRGSLQ